MNFGVNLHLLLDKFNYCGVLKLQVKNKTNKAKQTREGHRCPANELHSGDYFRDWEKSCLPSKVCEDFKIQETKA